MISIGISVICDNRSLPFLSFASLNNCREFFIPSVSNLLTYWAGIPGNLSNQLDSADNFLLLGLESLDILLTILFPLKNVRFLVLF